MACVFTCFTLIKLRRQPKLERVAAVNTAPEPQQEFEQKQNVLQHRPLTHAANHAKIQDHPLLPRFTWDELRKYTSNFASVIGSGGFSTVYLAQFPDSTPRTHHTTNVFGLGAVKIQCGSTQRLNQIYKQELQILSGLRHDHIVKLLGYCDDREEGVLVFEYVPNGNLQEKLHPPRGGGGGGGGGSQVGESLSWRSRVSIAFQLAQALEYLHHQCPLHIVHGDIKASNILLDQQLNCKLCDFGSAKMGFSGAVDLSAAAAAAASSSSHRNRRMMMMVLGSPGYTDPHYLWTGIASRKNDIYSFGVIVLELITGMEALNPHSGERLTSIAGPMLRDASKSNCNCMADARLHVLGFDMDEVKAMASIAAMCLGECPSLRPSAADILNFMRTNIPSVSTLSSSNRDTKL